MATGRIDSIALYRYRSWAAIDKEGWAIRACCGKCGTILKVDVKVVMAYRGREASPIDVLVPCKVWQCDGKMHFQGTWGGTEGTPWRRLTSTPA